jgi:hypothetical protein
MLLWFGLLSLFAVDEDDVSMLGEQGISNASHYYTVICGQCDLAHKGFVLYVENKEQADNAKEQNIESNPDHVIRIFEFTIKALGLRRNH